MKKIVRWLLFTVILFVVAVSIHLFYLSTKSASEKYPADSFYASAPDKKALIIVAHDDDIVGSTGTLAQWTAAGWNIRQMCFYQQAGVYREKDSRKIPIRKQSLQNAATVQGLAGVDPVDFNFRNDTNVVRPYIAIPYDSLAYYYQLDSLRTIIGQYIETYRPSVIFSLDDSIGGYGHPDHTVIGRLVVEYCRQHKNDSAFSVQKIYQSVFSPSLSESVMGDMEVYNVAKKMHGISGMPLPTVEFDISAFGAEKKKAMKGYTTEQNSLKKIWPYYQYYPGWLYFRIFDREFFKVIDVNEME